MRLCAPFTIARTVWRFGLKTRFVLLLAWLTLCPDWCFFWQSSHVNATVSLLPEKWPCWNSA